MPYNPQQYGLVQPPPPLDPMQSLSNLMTMGHELTGMQQQEKEAARATRVESALNTAKGNPVDAASVLEKQGDWATARTLRDKAQEIREKTVGDVMDRLNAHKTVFGQGEQFLTELGQRPELYPQMRPKLVELASSVDPNLVSQIPEQYDPLKVRNMLTWVKAGAQATDQRLRAAAALKDKVTGKEEAAKGIEADRKIVSDWFSVSPSQQDWDHSLNAASALGVDKTLLDQVGPTWSPDARERARTLGLEPKDRKVDTPNTIQAAILEARGKGDQASVDALIKLQGQFSAAGRAPETAVTADMIGAVAKNPTLWGDLSPTVRDKMLGPLSRAGFDFKAATSKLSDAQRATAERWKNDQLEQLEREFADRSPTYADDGQGGQIAIPPVKPEMDQTALNARKLSIENSYRAQTGLPAMSKLPGSWTGGNQAPPPKSAPASTATAGAAFKQEPVTGGKVRVTAPDGSKVVFPNQAAADAAIAEATGGTK